MGLGPVLQKPLEVIRVDAEEDGTEDGSVGDACVRGELAAAALFHADVGPPILE